MTSKALEVTSVISKMTVNSLLQSAAYASDYIVSRVVPNGVSNRLKWGGKYDPSRENQQTFSPGGPVAKLATAFTLGLGSVIGIADGNTENNLIPWVVLGMV